MNGAGTKQMGKRRRKTRPEEKETIWSHVEEKKDSETETAHMTKWRQVLSGMADEEGQQWGQRGSRDPRTSQSPRHLHSPKAQDHSMLVPSHPDPMSVIPLPSPSREGWGRWSCWGQGQAMLSCDLTLYSTSRPIYLPQPPGVGARACFLV